MIRTYLAKDRTSCLKIFKSNCPQYFDISELKDFEIWLNGQDHQKIAYQNTKVENYYVVQKDDEVIGCGGFYIVSDTPIASMAWGMIHHDFHKQGLGQLLFQFRLDAIKKTYPRNDISLNTSQHTFRFFERFDFKVIKITADGFAKGMDKYSMLFQGLK